MSNVPGNTEQDLLNKGVYSLREAARLASFGTSQPVSSLSIQRWLWGCRYSYLGKTVQSEPLWQPELPVIRDQRLVSFRDLIEIMFVAAFRREGVSVRSIRRILNDAVQLIADPYPLSSPEFRTDGRKVIAAALDPAERRLIFELESGQMVLDPFFDRLAARIEYTQMMQAARWWPMGTERQVVIDPSRRFGEPIVAGEGVPTTVLYQAFKAEKTVEAVSYWYGVPELAVKDAVEYEGRLAEAA
jgi:uncharacterized protein (DUF433 family)